MKKTFFILIFLIMALSVFAQRVYTVGILPFEVAPLPSATAGATPGASAGTSDSGLSDRDAAEATRLVAAELSSAKTLTILEGDSAKTAEYLVRGQISRQNNQIVLTATTSEARSGRNLNTAREQALNLGAIPMFSFCSQVVEYIPYPYLLGKWRSTIDMIDGPVTCIMEFRSDRTVQVQQYDTWEHNGTDSLKYQAIGSGTYTFGGYHLRRTVTINGRGVQTDATMGISLTLEDALPKYNSVSRTGLRLLFNDSKNGFELVNAGIPCGDNKTGPSVYPSESVFYTKFSKVQ